MSSRRGQDHLCIVQRAFHALRDLQQSDNSGQVVYLPTTHLTCTVEEFKAALERHGLAVTQVESREAFQVQDPEGIDVDWNGPGSNYYDRYNWTDKEHPPSRLGELRILPYNLADWDSPGFVALYFTRPVLLTDDLKQIRTRAWPLMESASAEDVSPEVKDYKAEQAEKARIAGLDAENTKFKEELSALRQHIAARGGDLGLEPSAAKRYSIFTVEGFFDMAKNPDRHTFVPWCYIGGHLGLLDVTGNIWYLIGRSLILESSLSGTISMLRTVTGRKRLASLITKGRILEIQP